MNRIHHGQHSCALAIHLHLPPDPGVWWTLVGLALEVLRLAA